MRHTIIVRTVFFVFVILPALLSCETELPLQCPAQTDFTLMASARSVNQRNLLRNGDFELQKGATGYPAHWIREDPPSPFSAIFSWSTARSVSGERSVSIELTDHRMPHWRQRVPDIDPATTYRFRSHVWATNVDPGSHDIELHWFTADGTYISRHQASATKVERWQEVIVEDIIPPATASRVEVVLRAYHPGLYYFDDIVLVTKDNSMAAINGEFPLGLYEVPNIQLVRNGNLETNRGGGFYEPRYWSKHKYSGNARQTWCNRHYYPAHHPNGHSLKTEVFGAGIADWQQRVIEIADGEDYSFWVYVHADNVTSGSHSVELHWHDANDLLIGSTSFAASTRNTWQRVGTANIRPPRSAVWANVVLRARMQGTYHFDDITLEVESSVPERRLQTRVAGFNLLLSNDFVDLSGLSAVYSPVNLTNTLLLEAEVDTTMRQPELAIWHLPDEPAHTGSVLLADLLAGYATIKRTEADANLPGHPVWLNHAPRGRGSDQMDFAALREYSDATDIVSMDIYPVGWPTHSNLANQSISCVGNYVDILYDQVVSWDGAQQKPIWMVLQGSARGDYRDLLTARIEVHWHDDTGLVIGTYTLTSEYQGRWIVLRGDDIQPPPAAERATIVLRAYQAGTYYFDNVQLIEKDTRAILLENATFELDDGHSGMPQAWVRRAVSPENATYTWSTHRSHSSSHSAQITTTSSDFADWQQAVLTIEPEYKYRLIGSVFSEPLHHQRPTYEQLRFMAYNAIIHGARGLFYYGVRYISVNSVLWQDLKKLATELRKYSGYLMAPPSFREVTTSHSAIEALLVNTDHGLFLIAANRENHQISCVELWISGLPLVAGMKLVDNRYTTLVDNRFQADFDAYQVHLYLIWD